MPAEPRKSNRGPAAAAANRHALLDAARRVFAAQGYHAPLNAVAREAGVGQGVLYRHFPTRLDLARAVFAQNIDELETIAAVPGAEAFERLWRRLVEMTIEASAFVELAVDSRRQLAQDDGERRLRSMLDATLPPAREAGVVDHRLTTDDVLLAQRMIFGVVVTTVDPAQITVFVRDALRLVPSLPSAVRDRESTQPP
ncbi:TetR/AcrR family transcriptional regulator [Pengzhenrongella frigida]|uniref:TetR/AcrR family transcriptional regulator n=1 Tax=Pengzhenrongella frigida TaxID=1259133 RepID=A0A4Q5MZH8_9MICO|nr:TetR/AcrR family transcriptional regulator [Cellulomonas sp. HLT2-17]RYV49637.1 TetR/AcrR family transcriptional regulator [Cellulomonas sp. HLT2-17]